MIKKGDTFKTTRTSYIVIGPTREGTTSHWVVGKTHLNNGEYREDVMDKYAIKLCKRKNQGIL